MEPIGILSITPINVLITRLTKPHDPPKRVDTKVDPGFPVPAARRSSGPETLNPTVSNLWAHTLPLFRVSTFL